MHAVPGKPSAVHVPLALQYAPSSAQIMSGHGSPSFGAFLQKPAQARPYAQSLDSMHGMPSVNRFTQVLVLSQTRPGLHATVAHGPPSPLSTAAPTHVPRQHGWLHVGMLHAADWHSAFCEHCPPTATVPVTAWLHASGNVRASMVVSSHGWLAMSLTHSSALVPS